MKKEEIVTLIIIVLIIIAEVVSQKFTKKCVSEIDEKIQNLKNETINNKEISCNELYQRAEAIYNEWECKNNILTFYIEHDELEKVNTQLKIAMAYMEIDKREYAVPELEEGIYILNHIQDKQSLSFANVF